MLNPSPLVSDDLALNTALLIALASGNMEPSFALTREELTTNKQKITAELKYKINNKLLQNSLQINNKLLKNLLQITFE